MAPNRRRSRDTIVVAASLFVIAAACIITAGCIDDGSTPSLAGTAWTLDSYIAGNGTLVPLLAGTEVTAIFNDDGRVSGSAGCNQYVAAYHLDGATLVIEPPGSTKMYCSEPPGIMEQENRYLTLLTEVSTWRVEGDRLILTDAEGTDLLFFAQAPEVTPAPFTGTLWSLQSYSIPGKEAVSSVIAGTTVTAVFSADGNVSGSAGCNHYGGGYTLDGSNLSVSTLFTTLMYCEEPEGVMEQESRYLGLLGNASTWRVEGDRLILTDAEGTDLLFFAQAPEVTPAPFTGTLWSLQSYSIPGKEAVSSVIAGTTVTAVFSADGNVSGSAGCNHYGGGYTLDGSNLSVSTLFTTLMYCEEPEGVMEQESRYLGLLGNASTWRVEGDRLILTDAEGTDLLFFAQAPEVTPAPFTGTLWSLQSYSIPGKEAVSSVIAGTTVTAVFSADGNVSGSAGCNHYGGGYTLDGSNLSVSTLFTTLMYCEEPEGVMEQESRYLGLLGNASTWRVEGDRLILTDAEGTDLLFFAQAPIDQES